MIMMSLQFSSKGLAFNRTKKLKKVKIQPSAEEKQQYLEKAQKFANDLVKELENEQGIHFKTFMNLYVSLLME